ncbi:sodium:alanine symporter family protein [Salinivibrio proteolyticus]|uniref:alanine/glycine:cation symporter family protein n=1 Tax=Salinivibrio TaxID=51366 RepID=UPI0009891E7E|nr:MULTISPECIES: sodium:alanine symporter family protein [Salinivibrio]OOF11500.1 sodium:alanine symporter family protein [Salinivibrio sp. PR5]OOF19183.1 sodium:alanine symporter family protein [Salinivibrio sp. PR932]OOF26170.1 sodium:alanine symporter family protein [Salinivibrio proteolyticus]
MSLLTFINDLIWGSVLIYVLIGGGVFFSLKLGGIQFRHFSHMFSVMRHSRRRDSSGISSFQALCTGLAARVGTGNMAGVAVALSLGGPGAIFWMWLMAFLGMATAFAESTLAQVYKVRDPDGYFRGGPAYYMEHGLGMRWMGILFSLLLILAFGLVFNSVQANSISQAAQVAFGWPPAYVGAGLALVSGLIIYGGLRQIARTAEVLVPVMALLYLSLACYVMLTNIEQVPAVISLVVKSAFGLHEAASGALGYTLAQGMIQGIKRGLFSNEAGMGSAPNAAASATPYPPHPVSQGYVQMLGVFVDTLVICTATVAIILLSGEYIPGGEVTGVELTQRALSAQVGDWGEQFVAVAIFFFAFTSIIANYSYAETNLLFINGRLRPALPYFRALVLGMVMFGALAELPLVWTLADASMGMMALVNMIAILLLSGIVKRLAADYHTQRSLGRVPVFDSRRFPELHSQLDEKAWPLPKQ